MVILNPTTGQLILVAEPANAARSPVFEPCAPREDAADDTTGNGAPAMPEAERPAGSGQPRSDGTDER